IRHGAPRQALALGYEAAAQVQEPEARFLLAGEGRIERRQDLVEERVVMRGRGHRAAVDVEADERETRGGRSRRPTGHRTGEALPRAAIRARSAATSVALSIWISTRSPWVRARSISATDIAGPLSVMVLAPT